jgi:hypothetical protein
MPFFAVLPAWPTLAIAGNLVIDQMWDRTPVIVCELQGN